MLPMSFSMTKSRFMSLPNNRLNRRKTREIRKRTTRRAGGRKYTSKRTSPKARRINPTRIVTGRRHKRRRVRKP